VDFHLFLGAQSTEGSSEETRILLRFANVPAGVKIFVTNQPVQSSILRGEVHLIQADALGGGAPTIIEPVEVASLTEQAYRIAPVELDGGWGLVVWSIKSDDRARFCKLTFGIAVAYASDLGGHLPGLGTATLSACLAPVSTVTTMANSAPVPRFAGIGDSMTVFSIRA
jgi:hypothetical protein